jgi:hypothetical protein
MLILLYHLLVQYKLEDSLRLYQVCLTERICDPIGIVTITGHILALFCSKIRLCFAAKLGKHAQNAKFRVLQGSPTSRNVQSFRILKW